MTISQANMRISAVDGTAFVDFSAAGLLTDYIGWHLTVLDSVGKTIKGYIKAAGTGETFESDVLASLDFNTWASVGTVVINSATQFTTTGNGGPYKSILVTLGVFKFNAVTLTYTAGDIRTRSAMDLPWFDYTGSPITGYRAVFPDGDMLYFRNNGSGTTTFISGTITQVLTPSATGVTIVSTRGGIIYNWESKEAGFNYNDGAGYTYTLISPIAIRQQIISKIDTRFKAILTTGGYQTNLGSNINWWKDLEKNPLQSSELPAANLKDSSCDPSPHTMGVDIHELNIECNVFASTIAATRQAIADVEKAIVSDRKWTNLALDTILLSNEIDVEQLENKFFGAIVPFKVSFLTKMGDPYTQP